ncbi:hypothetical protein OAG24_00955, partial [bacterium]|nr:hypothetical protein [bacterium]
MFDNLQDHLKFGLRPQTKFSKFVFQRQTKVCKFVIEIGLSGRFCGLELCFKSCEEIYVRNFHSNHNQRFV